jgi:DNA polymerase III epsilon subunit
MEIKSLDDIELTIFDTETTGLEPASGDRIVEIAAVRLKACEPIATFTTLVNPEREISEGAFSVNHITQEELKNAPKIAEVLPQFLDFIRGSCLCAYNAPFDMAFLNSELLHIGRPQLSDIIVVDMLVMAKRLMPGLARYALWFVAQQLGIGSTQAHRALADVHIAAEVFRKLRGLLSAKGINDVNGFLSLFSLDSHFLDTLTNQKTAQILEAISLGNKLKIRYFSNANAAVSEREVVPKEIKKDGNKSYLVGFCCLRQEERTFRIDGILHLELV